MIARLAQLRTHASVFRHPTGLTVAVFDRRAAELVPVREQAHRDALERPDRTTADHRPLAVLWLRQYPTREVLGFPFGVSDSTARRTRARVLPHREAAGKDALRMPDPGAGRRKKRPPLLADTPGWAAVIDSFGQRTHRPKRRQRAYYSGKKKAHTLKSQVGVDEESGRVADVSDSVPGPWADMKRLTKSRLLTRLPDGVGRSATRRTWASPTCTRTASGRPRTASRGGRIARRRTARTTGRSAAGGSWSSTPSGGCGGIGRSPR